MMMIRYASCHQTNLHAKTNLSKLAKSNTKQNGNCPSWPRSKMEIYPGWLPFLKSHPYFP